MTEPINLFHIADIHIGMENYGRLDSSTGLNSRVLDFLRQFQKAINIAIEREADLCIFAGDVYKNQRPNPTLQREFARRLKQLTDAKIPTVLLLGNHDMASADRAASSLDIFHVLELPLITVGHREEVYQIKCRRGQELQVAVMPYPQRRRLLAMDEYKDRSLDDIDIILEEHISNNLQILAAEAQQNPTLPTVLVGHFSVSEATMGSERSVMVGQDVIVSRSQLADPTWDYVALGHIHKHQHLNGNQHPPIVYPGSLERIDFGEERERKGFVMAQLQKGHCTWEFVPVNSRAFLTIQLDVTAAADPMALILKELADYPLDDAIVRLVIKATEEQEPLIEEKPLRQALSRADYVASIIRDVDRKQRQRFGNISPEELTPQEALTLYLETKNTDPERQAELLSYAQEIFKEEA